MHVCPRLGTLLLAPPVLAAMAAAQTLVHDLPGGTTGDAFGYRVAVAGDVDGDGSDEFLVSAPGWSGHAGRVELRSGASGAPLNDVRGAAGDLLGVSLALLGDIDGDQVADWVVGAPQSGVRGSGFTGAATGPGRVVVVSGATLSIVRTHQGASAGDAFGHSLAAGEDVDGDGVGDYVVGAPIAEAVYLYSGASGALIRSHPSFGPETGYAVALAPDLDSDGRADVVASMTQAFTGFPSEVRAFSGATGALLWTAGSGIGNELGWVILPTEDVDADGTDDVLVADREWGNSFGVLGKGRLVWLDGANGSTLHSIQGTSPNLGTAFGLGLAHLGDLDGDGLRDLAAASPGVYESNGFAYPGEPLRFLLGWPPAVAGSLPAPGVSATFGQALAAGDLDHDGFTDLVVGAPRDDGSQPTAGRVRVVTLLTDPQVYCLSQLNSQGCLPRISWTGTASAATSTLRVRAAGVLNQKIGLLFWSTSPASTPFGGGTLCIGSPLKRTPARSSGGNPPPADCSGGFAYQFTSAYLAANGLVAGTAVHCQYWSRDPSAASGLNLTDALRFSVAP